jgi:hypothetical protein
VGGTDFESYLSVAFVLAVLNTVLPEVYLQLLDRDMVLFQFKELSVE